MVLLFDYDLDINFNFFDIFVIVSHIINLKIFNINNKFGLNDINYYLSLISNI